MTTETETTTTTTKSSDLQPLGYDTRRVDPWLAVIRFALIPAALAYLMTRPSVNQQFD